MKNSSEQKQTDNVPSTFPQGHSKGHSRLRWIFELDKEFSLKEFHSILKETDWSTGRTKHDQTQSLFGHAAFLGIDPDTAEDLIREKIVEHGGEEEDRSVRRSRDLAYRSEGPRDPHSRVPRAPRVTRDPDFGARIIKSLGKVDAGEILRSRSAINPKEANLELILSSLYRIGEKVMIFEKPNSDGDCLHEVGTPIPDDIPMKAENGIFFLTNPVDGQSHSNPRSGGRPSRRSLESVTALRYLLLESDEVPAEDWLRILVQLPLPIAAVYRSGGKSIHSLVQIDAENKSTYDEIRERMLPLLGALGADRQATSAVRLSRLPTAYRGEIEQELLYLNSHPKSIAILNLEELR